MSKKKKRKADTKALRREIEALKAKLKEQGIEPVISQPKQTQKEISLDYQKETKTSNKKEKKQSPKPVYVNTDASYLIKDMKKTAIISFFTISAIVIVKMLKLF